MAKLRTPDNFHPPIVSSTENAAEQIGWKQQVADQYLDIIESLTEAIIFLDADGRITFFSSQAAAISGYTAIEIVGKRLGDTNLLTPDSMQIAINEFSAILCGKPARPIELDVLTRNGRTIAVEIIPRVLSRNGKTYGLQLVARDLSEGNRYAGGLIAQSQYLASLIGLDDLVQIARRTFDFILEMIPCQSGGLYIRPDDSSGRLLDTIYDFYIDKTGQRREIDFDKQIVILDNSAISRVLESGQKEIENNPDRYRGLSKAEDGLPDFPDRLPTKSQIIIPLAAGKDTFGLLIARNSQEDAFKSDHIALLELVSANLAIAIQAALSAKALKESQEKYQTLYNSALVGLFRSRLPDGKVLECNQVLVKSFGFADKNEFIRIFSFADYYYDPKVREYVLNILSAQGEINDFDICFRRKDGSPFWGRCSLKTFPEKGYIEGVAVDITEQKANELALQTSEINYSTIFNAVNDAVFVHDPQTGVILDANTRMSEMYGYKLEEILGLNFQAFSNNDSPYSPQDALRHMAKAFAGEPQIYEWLTKTKDGRPFWAEVNLKKISLGDKPCILAVVRNIDQRKRMDYIQGALFKISEATGSTENLEQLLEVIHYNLGTLIDTTDFYVTLYDSKTDCYSFPYFTNPSGKGDFAYRPLKKRITDYVRRKGVPLLARADAFVRLTAEGEIDLTGVPQPEIWLGVPLKTTRGVIGVVAVQSYSNKDLYTEQDLELMTFVSSHIAIAITRKQADEALILSEEKYRSLVDAVPDGIVITDLEENVIYINPAGCEIFGHTYEELADINLAKIIIPEDIEYVFSQTLKRKNLEKSRYQFRIRNKSRQLRTISISAAPMVNEAGNVTYTMGIFKDITDSELAEKEKQELREKLTRAQRMESLGLLAGGVAHDLNNMLGPLVAYPELIRMKLPPDSPIMDKITKIEISAQRAASIVQDLLTMARRGRYEMTPVYLNETITSYLDSSDFFELKQANPSVVPIIELTDSNPAILGSASHLSKMVMNLIINAYDAMPHGGQLLIKTESKNIDKLAGGYDNIDAGKYTILTVHDTGVGIDPKDVKRIFEPFYTKKQLGRSGSGLGLSIVYGVIKDHNGYIDIKTEINRGSEFIVYIPLLEQTPDPKKSPAIDIHGFETILVVDDIAEQRELASVILTSLGYKVSSAASGREAVDLIKNHPVNLVVLDMIMDGDYDGLDTYKEIIKLYPGQKAIITSGFSETERVKDAEKLGVGKYIKKPYTLQKLGRSIREVLDSI